MIVTPLPLETRAATGFTHKVKITYADLTLLAATSDTTVTIPIYPEPSAALVGVNGPAGMCCRKAAVLLDTAFDASDASINSLLLEIGDGGSTARFFPQTEMAVDGTEVLYFESKATTMPYAYLVADTIDVKFTVAGGGSPTIDELTSGVLYIFLAIVNLNELKKA
jgi:hypothetical protein